MFCRLLYYLILHIHVEEHLSQLTLADYNLIRTFAQIESYKSKLKFI